MLMARLSSKLPASPDRSSRYSTAQIHAPHLAIRRISELAISRDRKAMASTAVAMDAASAIT